MRLLTATLALVLLLLQCRIWFANDGIRGVEHLERAVAAQRAENARLAGRNRRLAAQVKDLKTGTAAIEELARNQLGMIGPNETFYQVVEPAPRASAVPPASSVKDPTHEKTAVSAANARLGR